MKVFWAWQSDHPSKVSRHFIRRALTAAIDELNETQDIQEPDEALQSSWQLDHDRKDLRGSPDLALEIMKKIEAADVFVGDVTPVGSGLPYKTDDGKEMPGKR